MKVSTKNFFTYHQIVFFDLEFTFISLHSLGLDQSGCSGGFIKDSFTRKPGYRVYGPRSDHGLKKKRTKNLTSLISDLIRDIKSIRYTIIVPWNPDRDQMSTGLWWTETWRILTCTNEISFKSFRGKVVSLDFNSSTLYPKKVNTRKS